MKTYTDAELANLSADAAYHAFMTHLYEAGALLTRLEALNKLELNSHDLRQMIAFMGGLQLLRAWRAHEEAQAVRATLSTPAECELADVIRKLQHTLPKDTELIDTARAELQEKNP